MIEITGVPDFSDILIHMGNTPADTRGCVLTGKTYHKSGAEDYIVGSSEIAYIALHRLISCELARGNEVYFNIID